MKARETGLADNFQGSPEINQHHEFELNNGSLREGQSRLRKEYYSKNAGPT